MEQTASPCPQKDLCGSCPWSAHSYPHQLELKLDAINQAYRKNSQPFTCSEILPSPVTAHYRNRMDFAIDFEGRVGLRQKGKWWRVIDNHHCFISDEKIEQGFAVVRIWTQQAGLSFFDRKKHMGLLRYAVLRASLRGNLMCTVVTSMPKDNDERQKATAQLAVLAQELKAHTLLWARSSEIRDVSFGTELECVYGPGVLAEQVGGMRYLISSNAFFQTNSRGAAILLDEVKSAIEHTEARGTFVDLFCGTGFFAIACAQRMQRTVGVELVPEAVRDARVNAEVNGVPVEFHDALAERYDWRSLKPDLMLVDPPRAGLHPATLSLLQQDGPRALIYVSCNFEAFAKEMQTLGAHYDLVSTRAVDMFPHTPHVELVNLLIRKRSP